MNTAVIYATLTGHSRKIADAAAGALGVTAQNVNKNPQLQDVDLLFIAGGIYAGKCNRKLVKYLSELGGENVKNAVLLTSCAGGDTRQNAIREILKNKGVNVSDDEYICKGNFLFMVKGHPSQEEIKGAADFAVKFTQEFKAQVQ